MVDYPVAGSGLALDGLLYCEHGVVAINKPAGLVSQAGGGEVSSVIPAAFGLLAKYGKGQRELYLVHRLDRQTSGVLLLAVGRQRAAFLAGEFRARRVQKLYLAWCHGLAHAAEFCERSPLTKLDLRTGRVRADGGGRPAETAVRVVATDLQRQLCLVACRPRTGRTHQIRVHLALNGLPIVGDLRYGAPARKEQEELLEGERHLLHAYALTFRPTARQEAVTLHAPWPADFRAVAVRSGLDPELLQLRVDPASDRS